jgi:phospholipid-binding lipoprotein MlaA
VLDDVVAQGDLHEAVQPVQKDPEPPAKYPVSEIVRDYVIYPIDPHEPWEGMNRRISKLNAVFDEYVFLPVVKIYRFIAPEPVRYMVSNFFNKMHEITTLINSLLQFKGQKFGVTLSRMLINTSIGFVGLFDVATPSDVPKQNEDFGQTLGFYGVGPGPYLVVPVFGPSTLRDAGGLVVDLVAYGLITGWLEDELDATWELKLAGDVLNIVDSRYQQRFRYFGTGSPFEYDLIRMLYLQKREIQIEN